MNSARNSFASRAHLSTFRRQMRGVLCSRKLTTFQRTLYASFSISASLPLRNIPLNSCMGINQILYCSNSTENPSSWWMRTYHSAFFEQNKHIDDGNKEKEECSCKNMEDLLPTENQEIIKVIRSICTSLSSLLLESSETATSATALNSSSNIEFIQEIQAVLLFLIHHRLRYFMIPSEHKSKKEEEKGRMDDLYGKINKDKPHIDSEEIRNASYTFQDPAWALKLSEVNNTNEKAFVRLQREDHERLDDLTTPVDSVALLNIINLVEVINSILDLPLVPITMLYSTQSILYELLLSALSVVEQLPSSTIAVIATCMAKCAEGYSLRLHLESFSATNRIQISWDEEKIYSNKSMKHILHAYLDQDALLATQAEQVTKYLADFQPGVNPVMVISHLNILCSVVRNRIEDSITLEYSKWKKDSISSVQNKKYEDTPDENAKYLRKKEFWDRVSVSSASDTPLVENIERRQCAEEAKLSLLCLEERKKKKTEGTSTWRRRAVGNFIHEKGKSSSSNPYDHAISEGSTIVNNFVGLNPMESSKSNELREITLSEVAEISSAMGFLRHTDASYWNYATWFTCLKLTCIEMEDFNGDNDSRGLNLVFKEIRNIAYALDYVRQAKNYTRLMDELVRMKFITEPVPSPSIKVQAMQSGVQ
ncbi:unnamed protein product [Phytomonas sp. Hart1]|nr:unnamed protein product [Phytomonas sp. Hart1]|eukprot:CCW70157.1 unnamed protein product [Phytomonas sp. isolate Hart1]